MIDPVPVNPNAFTNTNNIQGMFGTQVPNTFTRDVKNPYAPVQPTMTDAVQDTPIPPPAGVETPVTPPYDINNY